MIVSPSKIRARSACEAVRRTLWSGKRGLLEDQASFGRSASVSAVSGSWSINITDGRVQDVPVWVLGFLVSCFRDPLDSVQSSISGFSFWQ